MATVDPPADDSNGVVKISVNPGQLNSAYTISGPNVPFRPIRAFDDGSHVYIQLPPGMKTSEAPALLIAADADPLKRSVGALAGPVVAAAMMLLMVKRAVA